MMRPKPKVLKALRMAVATLYVSAFTLAHRNLVDEIGAAERGVDALSDRGVQASFAERPPGFPSSGAAQIAAATIPQNVLEPYSEMAFNLSGMIADDLRDEGTRLLQQLIANGAPRDEMIRELDGLFERYIEAGVAPVPASGASPDFRASSRLENISRTEFSKAYNTGRNAVMFDPDVDVITGVQFSAIMDHRTTEICQAWDGIVFDKDDAASIASKTPPLHYQCRSMLVPVTIYDDMPITPRSQWPRKPEQQPMAGFGGRA